MRYLFVDKFKNKIISKCWIVFMALEKVA